ncbi:MAG: biotin transporter BioY [Clostridia bacterium]|nr:biotin transporter BioY [Clostridia bacterium]
MKKVNSKLLAVDIAECAVFAALMVAGAFITIPFPLMPLTFQTVISVLAGLLLGARKGAVSMAVYCFAGLIGIPVFTGGGGIFYVLKPSFGYILGFILSAFVAGVIAGRKGLPFWRYIVGAVAAVIADYAVGVPYGIFAAHLLGVEDLAGLLVTGNLIYMPKDLVLSVLAGVLSWRVLPLIDKGRRKVRQK